MEEPQNLSEVAVKGTLYNFASLILIKLGGLIFTLIVARILLPSLFGIYALIFSIVTIFLTFTDLGIGITSISYISSSFGKGNLKESRSYARFFIKRKVMLVVISVITLLAVSKILSFYIYKNPIIFIPLLFSCLFIISESFRELISSFFTARKDLKPTVFFDMISQGSKVIFSILALLVFTSDFKVSGLFIAFFISSFVTLLVSIFTLIKKDRGFLIGEIEEIEKPKINSYWKYMAVASLSLVFFGSIDTLMLGGSVSSEYLGYYRAALSLILSVAALLPTSSIFLPLFTQIKKKRFERGFKKTLRYLLITSIPAAAGVIFLANWIVLLIYGKEFLPATVFVYFLSPLIITTPLIFLYSTILQSKEKPKIVSNSVLISLIVNILFNGLAIWLFKNNPEWIVSGVGLSTSLSRFILLGILIFYSKKEFGLKVRGIGFRKPLLSSIAMSLFLIVGNYAFKTTLLVGAVECILGVGIYLGILILLKGIKKEDLDLIKNLIKKRE